MGQPMRPGKTRRQDVLGTTLESVTHGSALVVAISLLGTALGTFSPHASALEAPPCAWKKIPSGVAVAEPESPPVVLQRMLAQLPDCQREPQFLAALGQLLNSQGRYVEASDHLERALLLEPDLKDAQLSYAIALAGSGDISSAKAMIDNLLSDPDLPAALRPLISNQKALLTHPSGNGNSNGLLDPHAWQTRFTLATRIGHDSNLLGSPDLNSLALTLAGQTIVLPLDENYLARPAPYARTEAQVQANRTTPEGVRWDAMASLRSRYSPAIATAGSSQIDLSIERSDLSLRPSPSQATNATTTRTAGSYVNASASALDASSGTQFSAWGLGAGWATAWRTQALSACQARTGLEFQERNYLDNEVLSGRYIGLSLNWSCESISGAQLTLGFKVGTDHPGNEARPGGVQHQASLKAAAYVPQSLLGLGSPAADLSASRGTFRNGFLLDLELSQQQDSSGYSPIIDSGRSRNVSRSAARVEYQYFFSRSFQAVLGAEWVGQVSSIALFGLTSQGAYTGLRKSW